MCDFEAEFIKIAVLQAEHEKDIKKTLLENTRGITKAETILRQDPKNKDVKKSLIGLKKK